MGKILYLFDEVINCTVLLLSKIKRDEYKIMLCNFEFITLKMIAYLYLGIYMAKVMLNIHQIISSV